MTFFRAAENGQMGLNHCCCNIRGYLNGVDETLQRKIKECHLEKLAGISFVLDRYGKYFSKWKTAMITKHC
ncbi:hypothetical protein [Phascolarctobacterium faecium]|uniref:hypothetical protein n=1 Tax=Phascolarctobacterium faecium TaxID=33025 RepID=UPI0035202EF6